MKSIVGVLLVCLALTLSGCGGSPSVEKPENPTTPPASGPQAPVGAGQQTVD